MTEFPHRKQPPIAWLDPWALFPLEQARGPMRQDLSGRGGQRCTHACAIHVRAHPRRTSSQSKQGRISQANLCRPAHAQTPPATEVIQSTFCPTSPHPSLPPHFSLSRRRLGNFIQRLKAARNRRAINLWLCSTFRNKRFFPDALDQALARLSSCPAWNMRPGDGFL